MIELVRLDEERERARQAPTDMNIRPALKYVDENYREEIRIEDMAKKCGMSESHFRRVFESTMNMRPVDYLNLIRVQQACTLIKRENISMEDVGYRVGYQTPTTFNRNFKRVTGRTPYQWKKSGTEMDISAFQVSALRGWEGVEGDHYTRESLMEAGKL